MPPTPPEPDATDDRRRPAGSEAGIEPDIEVGETVSLLGVPTDETGRRLSLRVVPMPGDTNAYGTVFGGIILSYIDQAGLVEAFQHGTHRWVTASIERVDFHHPVHVGDIVSLFTKTVRAGTKSVTIHVDVEAARHASGRCVKVTTANLTMVATDETGTPIPFRTPPTLHLPSR